MSEKEERGFDALIVSHLLRDRDLANPDDLPELTESERAAMNDVPADLVERLWSSEDQEAPNETPQESSRPDVLNPHLQALWQPIASSETKRSPMSWDHLSNAKEPRSSANRVRAIGVSAPSVSHSAEPISIIVAAPDAQPSARRWPGAVGYFSQIGPFSYVVSASLMAGAVLIAWLYRIPDHLDSAWSQGNVAAIPRDVESTLIGSIAGEHACRWAEYSTPSEEAASPPAHPSVGSHLTSGQRITLDSGLMEIAYQTGARVILEGPVAFKVDAKGGYLSAGKLTGRLETPRGPNPKSPIPNAFVIRTPTAIVTDLGTEFGVEVNEDGHTTSHVFRGSIAVRSVAAAGTVKSLVLTKGESVQVAAADDQNRPMMQYVDIAPNRFVRQMHSDRVPIRVFGTGFGLKGWQTDPHWEVVAVGNNPNFKPQPAVVINGVPADWGQNVPDREKWVSLNGVSFRAIPEGTICTFRTAFDLGEGQPETMVLRGRVSAVGSAVGLRLNGQEVSGLDGKMAPKYAWELNRATQPLLIESGFVAGPNVLEIDVASGNHQFPVPGNLSTLGLRAELVGSVQREP